MTQFFESTLAPVIGQLTDIHLERLHTMCSLVREDNRAKQLRNLVNVSDTHMEMITDFLKQNGYILHPNMIVQEPVVPKFDLKYAESLQTHLNPIPLILYFASFDHTPAEIEKLLDIHYYARSIHSRKRNMIDFITKAIKKGNYELDSVSYSMQYTKICMAAKKYGFRGYQPFYSALYFDAPGQSQNGWGLTLSKDDTEKHGYGMLSGDTVEDLVDTIHQTYKSTRRRSSKVCK